MNAASFRELDFGLRFAILAFGATALAAIVCYLHAPLGYNQVVYHYMGMVMSEGGWPYRDFVDIKGPAGLLVYGLPGVLVGTSEIGYRAFDLLIAIAIGVLLFSILRQGFSKPLALIGSLLWFMRMPLDGPGNTGDVTNLITLGLLAVLLLSARMAARSAFIIGAVTMAASWVKPTAAVIIMPVLVYVFWRERRQALRKERWPLVWNFVTGSLVVLVVVLAYLAVTKTGGLFWEAVVMDALFYHMPAAQFDAGRSLMGVLEWLSADPVFRVAGLLGLLVTAHDRNQLVTRTRIAVAAGFAAVIIENKLWPYHFSPLAPLLAIGVINGLVWLVDELDRTGFESFANHRLRIGAVIPVALAILLLIAPLRNYAHAAAAIVSSHGSQQLFRSQELAYWHQQRSLMVDFIKENLSAEETFYVLGTDPGFYLQLQQTTACRFANPGFALYAGNSGSSPKHRQRWQREILFFIEHRKPSLLIVDKNLKANMSPAAQKELAQFIAARYTEVMFETSQYASYFLRVKNG